MADLIRYGVSWLDLKKFVRSDVAADKDFYEEALDAAAIYLDGELGRRVELATGTPTARVYRPVSDHSPYLWIDDCVTVTSVVEDDTTLTANTDYVLEPLNGISASGEPRPYDRIARDGRAWYFDGPKPTVTVTADWGWASIPAPGKMALKVCAKAYLDSRDVKHGLATVAESGGVSEREAKAVRDFVRAYPAPRAWGIA